MPEPSEPRAPEAGSLAPEQRTSLLRALAAFLQATPAPELPQSVRRFRTFRPAALARHEPAILGLLDDGAMRARLVEWLDEAKPSLPARAREVLRAAVERGEKWEELLAAADRPGTDTSVDERERVVELERALDREKAKTKKARADARAARAQTSDELTESRREIADAVDRARNAETRLGDALQRAEAAEGAVRSEQERRERELRRARRDLDKLKQERGSLRAELKDLRRKVTRLENERSPAPPSRSRTRAGRRRAAPEEPKGPRRTLPVPPGRLQDAPETLDEWLEVHGVHLVVDGYNVTMAEGGFGGLELERQRDRLISEVTKLVRRKKASATIVFDGRRIAPGTSRLPRGPVKVEYSRPEEIADDHIVALIEGLPPYPVIVVTNDRELQERVRGLDATVATSDQLLGLIR